MRRLAVLCVLWPGLAAANVGRRDLPGDPTGEIVGVHDIAVAHEVLAIDLRPLGDGELVHVVAMYELDARGAAQHVPLAFASGAALGRGTEVTFDGTPVAEAGHGGRGKPTWAPPPTTPGLGGPPLPYVVEGAGLYPFDLDIAPGRHELRVRYDTLPERNRVTDSPVQLWQLAYVLAPARDWDGFAGLDVTIDLPPGWRAEATPALARTGDQLRGTFPALPADAIAITTAAPIGTLYRVVESAGWLAVLAVLGAGGGACVRAGRRSGRSDRLRTWPVQVAMAVGWASAVIGVGMAVIFDREWLLPAGQAASHGYGEAFETLGLWGAAVLGVVPLGLVLFGRAARRARPVTA